LDVNHFQVLIIGAGASGIGAAIKLADRGVTDFAVLEKADDIGGTWRDNTYPGCACDVPSGLYSYSFAPNPRWTRLFAGQPEIQHYLRDTATRFGVLDRVRFGVEVLDARWDDASRCWNVDTSRGAYTAQVVVGAAGPWHEPLIPEIPGLSEFAGTVFHSSRWNHDVDLAGKRVAVVGTGASAVQFVPEIAPQVSQLHLYQRTAQWVLPKPDHAIPGVQRLVFRAIPGARRALQTLEYLAMEGLGIGFRHPWLLRQVQRIGIAHLLLTVRDKKLRAKLTPDYTLGCKRLLMSNSYYPTLTRSNVDVHATALREIRGSTLVGADGSMVEADVIIFGTGFHILDMPVAERVHDADGISLAEHWKGSPEGYLGTVVSGYPNLFLLLGPNLGTGHSSAFAIIEAQVEFVARAIDHLRATGADTIEVRPQVQEMFNARVQAALPSTVYNAGGCSSYYLDVNGRNSFSWPWSTGRLRERVSSFDAHDFVTKHTVAERIPA
jgi:cation diffusion facilitator CzcD-associated flavoprotein CzcO